MLKKAYKKFNFSVRRNKPLVNFLEKLKSDVWPIRWYIFKDPVDLVSALSQSTKVVQLMLFCCAIGIITSISLFGYGSFLVFTKEKPTNGGDFYEGFLASELRQFNPVLELNNNAEKRVASLIYHPLYNIELGNSIFAENSNISNKIEPVLLSEPPKWIDNDNKELKMTLKKNLRWSNGQPITIEDIKYSFDRIKEEGGNNYFKQIFRNVSIQIINNEDFTLTSLYPNPSLIYQANFSPISKDFFSEQTNTGLITDSRSLNSSATSGYFSIPDTTIDPFTNDNSKTLRPNPIRNNQTNRFNTIVLTKSKNSNTSNEAFLDRYIISLYDSITSDQGTKSLEKAFKDNKLDFFERDLTESVGREKSIDTKNSLNLKQNIIPKNQIYTVKLNMQKSDNGYFVNAKLRRYVICNLISFKLRESYNSFYKELPLNQKLIPLQLNQSSETNCPSDQETIENELRAATDAADNRIYSINIDQSRNLRKVFVYGSEIRLNLLTNLAANSPILSEFRQFLLDIGLPTNEPISENKEIEKSFKATEKNYNLALINEPVFSNSLYPIYGQSGANISSITSNTREPIPSYNFESNLARLINNYEDQEAKKQITAFFEKEYVNVNLFQGMQEINFKHTLPSIDLYQNNSINQQIDSWFLKTKREL
jgi:hypothetical protein